MASRCAWLSIRRGILHWLLESSSARATYFAAVSALMDVPLLIASYSASKGAVISYTRTIAGEWGRYGIRANSVNPVVMTLNVKEFRSKLSPTERRSTSKKSMPRCRWEANSAISI
ncbi:SDR family oxidoreductase [Nocardia carnea]|uniref:SDR family oxidoreductase n=1 Tax=Nocardia carnea TaxID=37328 RepID=UPI003D797FC1